MSDMVTTAAYIVTKEKTDEARASLTALRVRAKKLLDDCVKEEQLVEAKRKRYLIDQDLNAVEAILAVCVSHLSVEPMLKMETIGGHFKLVKADLARIETRLEEFEKKPSS